ncbi:MAG TPA: hypothetical protein VGO62_04255 [Myxococcota bacterium]
MPRRVFLMRTLAMATAPLGFNTCEAALAWLSMNRTPALVCVGQTRGMGAGELREIARRDERLSDVPFLTLDDTATSRDVLMSATALLQ